MSQSTTNSLALHEIILSIADSLNEAQEHLRSMPPYDEYGRPNTLYQLPYLDFNLEVISQFESTSTEDATVVIPRSTGGSTLPQVSPANLIRFSPFRSTETTTKNQGIITSTISGRFVAVMPNEGLSQILLNCSAEITDTDPDYVEYRLVIRAVNAVNEPIAGQRIEINFDELTSLGFNSEAPVTAPIFTGSKDGYTDSGGKFSVYVRMDITDYDTDKTLVFVANSGTQFSSIAISKP
nr:hypothetical protein [uncultured Fluviicola sp.]